MSLLINFHFGTINRIYKSYEIGYYMRMKGRGNERYIIADGNTIEKDRMEVILDE